MNYHLRENEFIFIHWILSGAFELDGKVANFVYCEYIHVLTAKCSSYTSSSQNVLFSGLLNIVFVKFRRVWLPRLLFLKPKIINKKTTKF